MALYHGKQYDATQWHTRLVCLECGHHLFCEEGKVNRLKERVCPNCGRWICSKDPDSIYAELAKKMAVMPMRYVHVPWYERWKHGKPYWLVRFNNNEIEAFDLVKLKLKYAEKWNTM
jgi:hypothetical protein